MGLYGSPDAGGLYTKKEGNKIKKRNKKLQTNLWLWIALIIFDIFFVLTIGVRFDSIFTALILDSIIIGIISLITLIRNLIKKNKVKDDIIFLLSSIVAFFVLNLILGTVLNSI
ncbi:hypothetical protein FYJ27_01790 [Anaerosalibacter bizertensis]|uniref:Uncharacterized protein n=1 Tax=Anaerosalibacter bizertensis TaxID=932217 RepID=A0A844FER3_9FIRM|nr:hypothetical protein [Anaerosalibacter bizertensis]MSS42470.1 hypothetical protein [Anaerosalibacter bizertensis]